MVRPSLEGLLADLVSNPDSEGLRRLLAVRLVDNLVDGWLHLVDGWSWRRVSWLRSWWLVGSNVRWLFLLLQAAFGSRLFSCSSVSGKVFSCSSVSGKALLSSTNEWKKSRKLLNLSRCTRGNSQFYLESLIKIYSSRRDEDDKRRILLDAFNADLDQVTLFSLSWQDIAFPPRSRWRCH